MKSSSMYSIFLCSCIVLHLRTISIHATYTYIAGYEPRSDVIQHSRIDLDLADVISKLPSNVNIELSECTGQQCNWGGNTNDMEAPLYGICGGATQQSDCIEAYDIYLSGKYSNKSNTLRTLYAMGSKSKTSNNNPSTDIDMENNPFVEIMNTYWNSKLGATSIDENWSRDILEAAFEGESLGPLNFGTVGWDFRREVIQKGILYLNVFPYIIWEMQDAVNDCKYGTISQNDRGVHAWDEAVAFYTGSLEGSSQYGDSSNGVMFHTLADKRCKEFRTCTADYDNDPEIGYSVINREVFQEFIRGKDQIMGAYQSTSTEDCDIVTSTMNRISSLILNIFVQGTQRYLWKTRNAQSSKEAGELFIFATAILPFVDKVDSNCAEKLYNRAWNLDFDDDDWIDIKTCLEDTYAYLGVGEGLGQVTCARVGVLHEANTVSDGSWVPCVDATIIDESSNEKYILYGIGFGLGFLVMVLTTFSAVLYLRLRRHADSAKVYEGERKISMARAELV